MDSQAELRQGLHKMVEQVKDISILKAVYVILDREKQHEEGEDFYDTMHPKLQASIERGLAQIEKGQTVPHDEVRRSYEKWLK